MKSQMIPLIRGISRESLVIGREQVRRRYWNGNWNEDYKARCNSIILGLVTSPKIILFYN